MPRCRISFACPITTIVDGPKRCRSFNYIGRKRDDNPPFHRLRVTISGPNAEHRRGHATCRTSRQIREPSGIGSRKPWHMLATGLATKNQCRYAALRGTAKAEGGMIPGQETTPSAPFTGASPSVGPRCVMYAHRRRVRRPIRRPSLINRVHKFAF